MSLSSVRTITADAINNGVQASHLEVANPTADETYICRVTPSGQTASDTNVKLDVYGTYLYSLNQTGTLRLWDSQYMSCISYPGLLFGLV